MINTNFHLFNLVQKLSENNYLLWSKNSNKYIVLDSKIFNLINVKSNFTDQVFLNEICNKLNISKNIAKIISSDINDLILDLNQPKNINTPSSSQILLSCNVNNFYYFNSITIKVSFDSEETKRLIAPKFKHLQINNIERCDVNYSIFRSKNLIFIFKNNDFVGSWSQNEMHEFQGKFSMEFLCSIYNNSEHDWMGVFHASTISKNNQSIMFTGDSGNGKSTLVSILMANGYSIIADDFTPIMRSDLKTYCFPTAISVKEKSFDLIELLHPKIKDFDQYYIDEIKGHVKYLPPVTDKINANCTSVVWVKYGKDLDNNLE